MLRDECCAIISAGKSLLLGVGPFVVSRPRYLQQARHALDAVVRLALAALIRTFLFALPQSEEGCRF